MDRKGLDRRCFLVNITKIFSEEWDGTNSCRLYRGLLYAAKTGLQYPQRVTPLD